MSLKGPDGKQYVAVLAGIGGWAGTGAEDPTAGLGALVAFGDVGQRSAQGGVPTVSGLQAARPSTYAVPRCRIRSGTSGFRPRERRPPRRRSGVVPG